MDNQFFNNLTKMEDLYADTERQVIELNYVIPLDNDEQTYSPRLYNILQSTCGQVENMLKIICKKLQLDPCDDKFPCLFKALNVDRILENWNVGVIRTNKSIQPFKIENKTPFWWQKYNATKHNLPCGLTEGNIGNTINALAALFVLHNLGQKVKETPDKNVVLNKSKLSSASPTFDMKMYPKESILFPSQLFISLTYYSSRW